MKKDNRLKNNIVKAKKISHYSFLKIRKEIEEDDMDNLIDYLVSDDYPFKDNI